MAATLKLTHGPHTLQLRSGRNSSRTKTFDAAEGETIACRCFAAEHSTAGGRPNGVLIALSSRFSRRSAGLRPVRASDGAGLVTPEVSSGTKACDQLSIPGVDYLKGTVTGPGTLENTAMKSRSSGVR